MYARVVKRSPPPVPEDDGDISTDMQQDIATEVALKAAVDMVVFMVDAWNELVAYVESEGVRVSIQPEAAQMHTEIVARLRASLIVVRDAGGVGTTDETMKGFTL